MPCWGAGSNFVSTKSRCRWLVHGSTWKGLWVLGTTSMGNLHITKHLRWAVCPDPPVQDLVGRVRPWWRPSKHREGVESRAVAELLEGKWNHRARKQLGLPSPAAGLASGLPPHLQRGATPCFPPAWRDAPLGGSAQLPSSQPQRAGTGSGDLLRYPRAHHTCR